MLVAFQGLGHRFGSSSILSELNETKVVSSTGTAVGVGKGVH